MASYSGWFTTWNPEQASLAQIQSSSSFRSYLRNGTAFIDQRNNGASGAAINVYTVDGWQYAATQASKFTWGQNLTAVTPPPGFATYLGFTSSSSYTVGVNDYFGPLQQIEATYIQNTSFGTSSAIPINLSFYVYSSLTGTFSGGIRNGTTTRSFVFTFSITSANTWTYISIPISGDTSGTWALSGTSAGASIFFSLGTGSTNSTSTTNAWQSGNYFSASGSVSVAATSGATFFVTGVQLEPYIATPFEYLTQAIQIVIQQRYYQVLTASIQSPIAGVNMSTGISFVVPMRISPSQTLITAGSQANVVSGYPTLTIVSNSAAYFQIQVSGAGGYSVGTAYGLNADF